MEQPTNTEFATELALTDVGSVLRKARGLRTQDEISQASGFPQSVLSRVEKGKYRNLTLPMILRLCLAYGATPSVVIGSLDHCAVIAQRDRSAA